MIGQVGPMDAQENRYDLLVRRVAAGMTDVRDARIIEQVFRRYVAEEIALRRIAKGRGASARFAAEVLREPEMAFAVKNEGSYCRA